MPNSVRPHRRQPTRLHSPWDSPGKNTGVGCHFLLQSMKVKSKREVAQSCLTQRPHGLQPTPASSVHGIFQARVLEWVAIAFSNARTKEQEFLPEHDSVMNASYTEIKLFRPKDAQTERDKNCDHTNKVLLMYLGYFHSCFSIELPSQR